MAPEIRYALNGDVHIAYCTLGEGPTDLVYVAPYVSNIELMWDIPDIARFLRRLAAVGRLICIDKRGFGLSDRLEREAPDLETRMDDIRAVMDAAGSERAFLYSLSESGFLGITFAASHPDRVLGLILQGAYPRGAWAPDWQDGTTEEGYAKSIGRIEAGWGNGEMAAQFIVDSSWADDRVVIDALARLFRNSASPAGAIALERWEQATDVRDVLPTIRVPTLILNRQTEGRANEARYMAQRIPGARHVEHPGHDHIPWLGDWEAVIREVERFVEEVRQEEATLDRVLATVMFTDIVGSTQHAAALGDRGWAEVLRAHHDRVRGSLARYRGREVDTAGDGFFATFDGPARAIRCARAIVEGVGDLGIEVRAGVHTGECEVVGEKVGGLAVHIGARVAAEAGPGEVLATSTVRDLVAGSGLAFSDRGEHELRGVPGPWHLYRAEADGTDGAAILVPQSASS